VSIPENILNKYGLPILETFRENMQPGESEIMYYEQFLKSTDHIPLTLIEGSVSSSDVAEELKYREIARQEIARLEGKPNEPKADKITLDARITSIEADVFSMAVDHEERIIMMELGLTE
jgi:hypothetical protein